MPRPVVIHGDGDGTIRSLLTILVEPVLPGLIALECPNLLVSDVLPLANVLQTRIRRIEEVMEVAPHTLAKAVSIVCRRHIANRKCSAGILVAQPVCQILELLGSKADGILEDEVVCWTSSSRA